MSFCVAFVQIMGFEKGHKFKSSRSDMAVDLLLRNIVKSSIRRSYSSVIAPRGTADFSIFEILIAQQQYLGPGHYNNSLRLHKWGVMASPSIKWTQSHKAPCNDSISGRIIMINSSQFADQLNFPRQLEEEGWF